MNKFGRETFFIVIQLAGEAVRIRLGERIKANENCLNEKA